MIEKQQQFKNVLIRIKNGTLHCYEHRLFVGVFDL